MSTAASTPVVYDAIKVYDVPAENYQGWAAENRADQLESAKDRRLEVALHLAALQLASWSSRPIPRGLSHIGCMPFRAGIARMIGYDCG